MKNLYAILVVVLCSFILLSAPQHIEASSKLDKTVKANIGISNSSMTLRSAETGKIIYNHNGSVPRQTASNLKLLTGAAVLQELGEDFRFETNVYIDGELLGNVLNGDIYLQGSGDPTLLYSDLQEMAKELKQAGVKQVNGHIYLDDTVFTGSTLPPGAPPSEQTYYYAARTSALNLSPNEDFDAGTVIVQATGTKSGKAPDVKVIPHISGQKIVNRARTGKTTSLSVRRQYNTNQIIISGTIAPGRSVKQWVTVQDPTIATGHALKGALTAVGIKFAKNSKITPKAVVEEAQLIYTNRSRTLKAMFPTYMKLSNNSMADVFLRTLAVQKRGKGSLSTGAAELKKSLSSLNVATAKMTLLDGSGLSSKNRVQSNQISSLLYEMQKQPTFDTFYASLPVGGNSNRLIGGTLKNRFTGAYKNRVYAKTGYIDGVYTLSGYVKAKSGKTYIFSILTEKQSSSAISSIDRVVKTIIDTY